MMLYTTLQMRMFFFLFSFSRRQLSYDETNIYNVFMLSVIKGKNKFFKEKF